MRGPDRCDRDAAPADVTLTVRDLAHGLVFTATDAAGSSGDGVRRCRRVTASRVGCMLNPEHRCDAVLTLRLGTDRRLRWGTYKCPTGKHRGRRKHLRRLHRNDVTCELSETDCPPPLFGRVADRWLVPRD